MKVIGICGSPNGAESTSLFGLKTALAEVEAAGVETEIIALGEHTFGGCIDCGACRNKLCCSQDDDFTNKIIEKLDDPEIAGFIFSTPVYFGGITAQLKTFIDRAVIFRRNGFRFEDKVAGAISVGCFPHGGQGVGLVGLIQKCTGPGPIVVPEAAPTSHFGSALWSGHPEGIESDAEGMATAKNVGKKVAQVCLKLHG